MNSWLLRNQHTSDSHYSHLIVRLPISANLSDKIKEPCVKGDYQAGLYKVQFPKI